MNASLLHVLVAIAVVAAVTTLCALGKFTAVETLGPLGVVLGWAVNASGVTSGAQAANSAPNPPPAPPAP